LLKEEECFQAEMPRFAEPGVQADYQTTLRRAMAGRFRAPGLLPGYVRHLNESVPAKVPPGPHVGTVIALATPSKPRIRRADNDTIFIAMYGERITFPMEASALLHFLFDNEPVSVAEFHENFEHEFSREELSDLLSVLSKAGIVAFRRDESE
jgi:hypothetical protein